MHKTLSLLTDTDRDSLLADAVTERYARNEVIIAEGAEQNHVYLIREGVVRVTRMHAGRPITFRRLGPEEVVGEMSFLERRRASASVVAESDVVLKKIEGAKLESLLASDPGFSARVYQSLSVTLSTRLRETAEFQSGLNVQEIAQVNRFHATRLGCITRKQIPRDLIERLDAFDLCMQGLLQRGDVADGELNAAVREQCEGVIAELQKYTGPEALVEIGYDDLLAYRDTDQLRTGVGAYVFRETFRWFMLSETIAHCYMKPRGFSDDYITNQRIQNNAAHGDGAAGAAIDRWFLGRPFASSRRAARKMMAELFQRELQSTQSPRLMSLASGAAPEAMDYLSQVDGAPTLTLVDIDAAALAAGGDAAERRGILAPVHLIEQNVLAMIAGQERLSFEEQHGIYAAGMTDYLEDADAAEMLNWMHARLTPGGFALVSVTQPGHPDSAFLEHILEWMLRYRTQADLARLIAASKFQEVAEWHTTRDGVIACALLRRS